MYLFFAALSSWAATPSRVTHSDIQPHNRPDPPRNPCRPSRLSQPLVRLTACWSSSIALSQELHAVFLLLSGMSAF